MQGMEKSYIRILHGERIAFSSSQIADSYLQNRISRDELFEIEGKSISFEELFCQDEAVRSMIRRERPIVKTLFPESNEVGFPLRKRINLFWRIILRGDDSLVAFFLEQDKEKERVVALEHENKTLQTELLSLKRDNSQMISVCQNFQREFHSFISIVEVEQKTCSVEADAVQLYSRSANLLKNLARTFENKLKRIISFLQNSNISESANTEAMRQISMIEEYRRNSKLEVKELQDAAKSRIQHEYDELEISRQHQEQEINSKREELKREIESWEAKRNAQEQHAMAEQKKIEEAYQQLGRDQETVKNLVARNKEEMLLAFERKKEEIEKTASLERERLNCEYKEKIRLYEKKRSEDRIKFSKSFFSKLESINPRCICQSSVLNNEVFNNILPKIYDDIEYADSSIAFFDCSLFKNKKSGILVTDEKIFFVLSSENKKVIRMTDVCNNKLVVNNAMTLKPWMIPIIVLFVILGLIVAAIPPHFFGIALMVWAPIYLAGKTVQIECKNNPKPIVSFFVFNKKNLIAFCDAINQASQTLYS